MTERQNIEVDPTEAAIGSGGLSFNVIDLLRTDRARAGEKLALGDSLNFGDSHDNQVLRANNTDTSFLNNPKLEVRVDQTRFLSKPDKFELPLHARFVT